MINRPDKTYRYFFISLLSVLAAVLLFWAAYIPPVNSYELEIMEAASGMVDRGDWGTPRHAHGEIIYHTPILPFWLAAAGHVLLPDSPLGYRLFNIVLALAAFTGFYTLICLYLDARTAFYSSGVLAGALFFSWQLQLATPDSLYALSICTAVFAFYLYLKTTQSHYFWYLYGSLVLGLLSKGLIAFIIPLLIMVIHLMFRIKMNKASFQRIRFLRGIGLILLLVLPWYVYIAFETGGDWFYRFWDEYHLERYFGDGQSTGNAFYLPFAYGFLGLLPMGVFLFRALPFGWKYRVRKDLMLLCLLGILVILTVFAISSSFYPHYILPALPFGAILIGYRLSQAAGRSLFKMNVSLGIILLGLLAVVAPVYLYFSFPLNLEKGYLNSLYVMMLLLPPVGTAVCFGLWFKKKTDEGIFILSLSFLFFNALLMFFALKHETLGKILAEGLLF
jgi:4-amino-4-deoxy-L-arabinose transferase-like glycosyltransferase